jgi:hypothetical protein
MKSAMSALAILVSTSPWPMKPALTLPVRGPSFNIGKRTIVKSSSDSRTASADNHNWSTNACVMLSLSEILIASIVGERIRATAGVEHPGENGAIQSGMHRRGASDGVWS